MEAAAAVIAERGFEAATMAEIASRAGALVGSLYHFFPNKEVLADALIQRYGGIIEEAFARIDGQAALMPIEALAEALLDFMVELQGESKAMVALMEARDEYSAKQQDFRELALRHIAGTLMLRSPQLPLAKAEHIAVVLLHNMKTMKSLASDPVGADTDGPTAELRHMTRIYLRSRLHD
jgi:AcrR family transcriptional regulator